MNRKPLPAIASRAKPSAGYTENVSRLRLLPLSRVPTPPAALTTRLPRLQPLQQLTPLSTKLPPLKLPLIQQLTSELESDEEVNSYSAHSTPYEHADDCETPEVIVPRLDLTAITGCRPGSTPSYRPASSLGSSASSTDYSSGSLPVTFLLPTTRCDPTSYHLPSPVYTPRQQFSPVSVLDSTDRKFLVPHPPASPKQDNQASWRIRQLRG